MNVAELRAELTIELDHMRRIVDELRSLRRDVGDGEPSLRERAAGGSFLMQFYNGVENVLKRISKHAGVPVPQGSDWHVELFQRFCEPPTPSLPVLFDPGLAVSMREFRAFRHVARSGYAIALDWEKLRSGIDHVGSAYERFRDAVSAYLDSLDPS
jgi:hypothetical protein